ncbi:MAG: hypothetical protein KDD83_22365, partial [Caldilineaceae bacterium]|nr:hypothetical protein [Caldilineaceae bacterium]
LAAAPLVSVGDLDPDIDPDLCLRRIPCDDPALLRHLRVIRRQADKRKMSPHGAPRSIPLLAP